MYVEVRGQLVGTGSLLLPYGWIRCQILVVWLGSKCLYPDTWLAPYSDLLAP